MGFNSMIIFGTVVLTFMLAVSAAPPSDVKELRTTSTQQDKAVKPGKTTDVEPHAVEEHLVKSSAAAGPVIPENNEKTLKAGVSTDSKSLATKDEALKSSETAGLVYGWGYHYPYYPYNYYYNYPYYYL